MGKIPWSIKQWIYFGIWLFICTITFSVIALSIPSNSPTAWIIPEGTFFTDYLSKMLVDVNLATTNWTVKKSMTTEQIQTSLQNSLSMWDWTKFVDSTVTEAWWKLIVRDGIIIGSPATNQILVNRGDWTMMWASQNDYFKRCRTPFPNNLQSALNAWRLAQHIWIPSTWNQEYRQSIWDNGNLSRIDNCGYTCTVWWIGESCEIREELPAVWSAPSSCRYGELIQACSWRWDGGVWNCAHDDRYWWVVSGNCPINWWWSSWSSDGSSNQGCDGYTIYYEKRTCNNPEPRYGGLPCSGPSRQESGRSYNWSCCVSDVWSSCTIGSWKNARSWTVSCWGSCN